MVNVAIIDDGVNFSQIGIGKNHSFSLDYDSMNQSFKLCNEAKYMNNHGTICAEIIYNYVETKEINYYSLKILNAHTGMGNINQLKAALEWCINNDIDVVNCSLGSIFPLDVPIIKPIIEKIQISQIIVIAAMNNKNIYTIPACFPGIIGVKHNILYSGLDFLFKWHSFDEIEIETCGESKMLSAVDSRCNSFATAKITAIVVNSVSHLLCKRMSHTHLLYLLQRRAKTIIGSDVNKIETAYPWNSCFIYNQQHLDTYKKSLKRYLKHQTSIDIPIVSIIRNEGGGDEQILHSLLSYFTQQGIYNQALTDDLSIARKNRHIVFVPPNIDYLTYICNLQKKFIFDTIIVFSSDIAFSADVSIIHKENIICVQQADGDDLEISTTDSFSEDYLSKMILQIISE